MDLNGFVYDIEADDLPLYATKVWYIRMKSLDGTREKSIYPFRVGAERAKAEFLEFVDLFNNPIISGHFILGYDNFVIWHLLGIVPRVGKEGSDWLEGRKCRFLDTYYMSMYVEPSRPSHSLESLTNAYGSHKIGYRQQLIDGGFMLATERKGFEFSFYNDLMVPYCDQDVDGNIVVFKSLNSKLTDIYGPEWYSGAFKLGQKSFYLMQAQALTGVKFAREDAVLLEQKITEDIQVIEAQVLPQLPPRRPNAGEMKSYIFPAKPFKKNGEVSASMEKFVEKHNGKFLQDGEVELSGKVYKIAAKAEMDVWLPMELKHQDDFKAYLLDQGWVPSFWNLKKDANGKIVRDDRGKVIETSPKLQEQGKLCPNLEQLEGALVKLVVKYLSLRNRRGVLQGWLANPRLDLDGRLSAKSSGIANTHRQMHSEVCNVPRVGSILGEEFRKLFIVDEGMVVTGADSSGLEQRIAGHYTHKYDNGAYADELLKGDVHSKVAIAFYPDELAGYDHTSEDFDKDTPEFKPYRNKAKTGGYAILYGCSPGKLAKTLGKSERDGKRMHDAYWEANPALMQLRDKVEAYWKSTGRKTYMPAVDGRMLCTRSQHSLLNIIFQSAGAIACDAACCFMDNYLGDLHLDERCRPYYIYKGAVVKRVIYYHDEYSWEHNPEVSEEIRTLVVKAFVKGGEYLKLSVPLAGEAKTGLSWYDIH